MAGVNAILNSFSEGKWPLCHDKMILQPLDILFLLFKNKGANATFNRNVCFPADRFLFPPLRNLLPDPTPFFTPDDFVDSLVCLFLACITVTLCMIVGKFVWERVDSQFASVNPSHKKWYVVANLSKSFILGCMCLTTRYWVGTYRGYIEDNMDGVNVKRCGMLYIATDVVALLLVPKLPFSTIMHHAVTAFIIIMMSAVNIEVDGYTGLLGVGKMAILYGIFSTIAFPVNSYLALRVVYFKSNWLHILVHISLWPYILCCACNWSTHVVWLCSLAFQGQLSVVCILYVLAITAMVNDDIVLIKWLIKRSSPGVGKLEEKEK